MKITITESQYKKLILESKGEAIEEKLKESENFFSEVSKETKKIVGFDLSVLITFSAAIGGFMYPITEFIKGNFPELRFSDLCLISAATIITYYHSNKKMLAELLDLIKERGLVRIFDEMLSKADELKKVFISFIESLAIPIGKIGNMMAFTFLIPVLGDILDLTQNHDTENISLIIYRIIMFFSINYGSVLLKRLIFEIVKRFKS